MSSVELKSHVLRENFVENPQITPQLINMITKWMLNENKEEAMQGVFKYLGWQNDQSKL